MAVDVVAEVLAPAEVAAEIARLRSPVAEICGSSWPRTTSMLSRAASSGKAAEMTFGLAPAARVSASSRVAGTAGRPRTRPVARRGEPARRIADGAGVIGPADFELALGGDDLRFRLLERGLRLRQIGAGQLADLGADPRRFEFLAKHIFVVAVDREQVLVAHDVEIGLRHRLEDRRLDRQGLRPGRLDG